MRPKYSLWIIEEYPSKIENACLHLLFFRHFLSHTCDPRLFFFRALQSLLTILDFEMRTVRIRAQRMADCLMKLFCDNSSGISVVIYITLLWKYWKICKVCPRLVLNHRAFFSKNARQLHAGRNRYLHNYQLIFKYLYKVYTLF